METNTWNTQNSISDGRDLCFLAHIHSVVCAIATSYTFDLNLNGPGLVPSKICFKKAHLSNKINHNQILLFSQNDK